MVLKSSLLQWKGHRTNVAFLIRCKAPAMFGSFDVSKFKFSFVCVYVYVCVCVGLLIPMPIVCYHDVGSQAGD